MYQKIKGCQPSRANGLIWHSVFNLLKSLTFYATCHFYYKFFLSIFAVCHTVAGLSNIKVMNAKRLIHYNYDSKTKNVAFDGTLNSEQHHFLFCFFFFVINARLSAGDIPFIYKAGIMSSDRNEHDSKKCL